MKMFSKAKGNSTLLTVGLVIMGLGMGPIVIDIPTYFAVQQQMKTAVDAAALASASQLPQGQNAAKAAGNAVAAENLVGGKTLQPSDLTYTFNGNQVQVRGETTMKSVTASLFCAMQLNSKVHTSSSLGGQYGNGHGPGGGNSSGNGNGTGLGNGGPANNSGTSIIQNCDQLKVAAGAQAEPAARDTVLVIDTSSSMTVTTGGQTLISLVKTAANRYVDTVLSLNNSAVDRIAVVKFDQSATKKVGLTSKADSPGFSSVKSAINNLSTFNGTGWNTNYEQGLKVALDELQNNGRQISNKQVIFMTDGYPNLPAPTSPTNYYSYDNDEPYRKCTDIVNNSTAVQNLCYTQNRQRICPTLPSSQITDSMISTTAVNCGKTYTDFMENAINAQSNRAASMKVSIATIRIWNNADPGTAYPTLKRLIKNPNWDPNSLDYMATTTGGQQYEAQYYDSATIDGIYQKLAKTIRVKLSR